MINRIKVSMAAGEADRERSMRSVLSHDTRFEPLQIDPSIPVDLMFSCGYMLYEQCATCKVLNMELKRPDDFVQSVLSGHLYDQTLSIRESGYSGCTVILGDLGDIAEAIRDASKTRAGKHLRGDELGHAIASTHSRCKSFRKRSFLNGIPVFYIGDDSGFFDNVEEDEHKNKTGVWKDVLELAHDYLCDGDMLGFRQRPAENEREVAAASMMHKGIGSDSMRILLKEYTLAFVPRGIYAKPIEELPGWGPKRCKQIADRVRMVYR
jgi:hypothetical protein